ncbi:hypothetical protein [Streptomyces sp. PA5.6]|uniref:hypothetical protein n=1 Tax=Streptomyces sp. PA5.6 TaxID=3035651 RepID=UPI003904D50E
MTRASLPDADLSVRIRAGRPDGAAAGPAARVVWRGPGRGQRHRLGRHVVAPLPSAGGGQ